MSKLEDLIAELCPNGVEYKKISDVADYEQPTKYIVKSTKYDNSFATPVLTAGQSFILGYTDELDNIYLASKDDPVIIFDDFTGAIQWVDFPFKVKSSAMKMITANSNVLIRYLYHWMALLGFSSSEHKRLWISTYSNFEIPVPPLDVQAEIVQILDTFTELTENLTAELTARSKQYEYYRDTLLTFDDNNPLHSLISRYCPNGLEYHSLEELFVIKNGYTPSKSNSEFRTNGTVPWFRMDDIRAHGRVLSDSIQHVTKSAVKGGKLFPANSIILATTATIGEHALVIVDSLANQQFTFFSKRESLGFDLDMKYVFYCFFIIDEWCKRNVNAASFASVDMPRLRKLEIPIPPLDVQRQIVQILDRFDALCNDLTQGLPAEIEARRNQYEYYRDQLLTFKHNVISCTSCTSEVRKILNEQ